MSEPTTAAGDALLTDLIQDHEAPSYHVIERVRRGILAIEAEAQVEGAAEVARLREALAFAASVMKSGEPWTDTCERVIDGALRHEASR